MTSPFYEVDWSDPDNLVERIDWVMDRILQSIEERFEFYGIELPELRYKHMGEITHDCEQVTVSLVQVYLGPPGDQAVGPQPCDGPRSGVFQIEVVRCYKDGSSKNLKAARSTAVDPNVANEYSKERARDLWALLDSAKFLPEYNAVIADAALTDPEGQFQAAMLNLTVQL